MRSPNFSICLLSQALGGGTEHYGQHNLLCNYSITCTARMTSAFLLSYLLSVSCPLGELMGKWPIKLFSVLECNSGRAKPNLS